MAVVPQQPLAPTMQLSLLDLLTYPAQVGKTPCWPRSWANSSRLELCFHRNPWADLRLLGPPDTSLATHARR